MVLLRTEKVEQHGKITFDYTVLCTLMYIYYFDHHSMFSYCPHLLHFMILSLWLCQSHFYLVSLISIHMCLVIINIQ